MKNSEELRAFAIAGQRAGVIERLVASRKMLKDRILYQGLAKVCMADCIAGASAL
jgi:hypothetical protein